MRLSTHLSRPWPDCLYPPNGCVISPWSKQFTQMTPASRSRTVLWATLKSRVHTAERQPGSTFKPITYLTAFLKGWSPATIVADTPLTYVDDQGRSWSPKNNDLIFRGPVSVRTALA